MTNIVTGDKYIGATKHPLSRRKKQHLYDAKSRRGGCKRFCAALRKYGEDAFHWEVLSSGLSLEAAMEEEVRLILERKPAYNITAGGRGLMGIPRTPEWTEKISAALRGRRRSAEARAKMASLPPNYRRPIVCLNDGEWFAGIALASARYGIDSRKILAVCNGEYYRTRGLYFVDAAHPISAEERAAIIRERETSREKKRATRESLRRSVTRLSDGRVYASVSTAAKDNNVHPSSIVQSCRLGSIVTGCGQFSYSDVGPAKRKARTAEELAAAAKRRQAALSRGVARNRKVIVREDGKRYDSITSAARDADLSISAVSAAVYRNGRAGGYTFHFAAAQT